MSRAAIDGIRELGGSGEAGEVAARTGVSDSEASTVTGQSLLQAAFLPRPSGSFPRARAERSPPRPRGSASQAPGRGEDRPEAASGGFRRLTPSCSLPPADLAPPPRPRPLAARAQRPRPPARPHPGSAPRPVDPRATVWEERGGGGWSRAAHGSAPRSLIPGLRSEPAVQSAF
nr:uncharacterized protein LOC116151769 [Camelus dromedarius]